MNYFKIIIDGIVKDIGATFLKWNSKHNMLFCCDVQDAEYAQSYTQNTIYHDNWLKPISNTAVVYTNADIVIINATEYDELKALLDDGEQIIVPPEEQQPIEPENPSPDEPQEEQHPMTVSEMRSKIIQQQQQIDMLTSCLLEMSEIVYA